MSRRTIAIAAALSVLALGSPLLTGCTNPLATQYFDQRVEKYEVSNYQAAIADYTKVIDINPRYSDVYYHRGTAKYFLYNYQGAIADYTKAIEINPQDEFVYTFRGLSREWVNDLEGACDDWRKAVDLGNERPAKWLNNQS